MYSCAQLAADLSIYHLTSSIQESLVAVVSAIFLGLAIAWFKRTSDEAETVCSVGTALVSSVVFVVTAAGAAGDLGYYWAPASKLPDYCIEGSAEYQIAIHPAPVVAAPVQSNTCESTP